MSLQVEKLEKSMAKLTIEVSAEEFEKAENPKEFAYKKKSSYSASSLTDIAAPFSHFLTLFQVLFIVFDHSLNHFATDRTGFSGS